MSVIESSNTEGKRERYTERQQVREIDLQREIEITRGVYV